ncbi:MAG TPA: Hsp20/alpha crystallin family protein [Vicinamibacterales bacterium]|nr:Hsp20/alpha crystallin family protein [Vicinamibacterales bacterium]
MPRIFLDRPDLPEDVRQLFEGDPDSRALLQEPTEWSPSADVLETPAAVEIVVDLPGVQSDAVEVVLVRGAVIITGRKAPSTCPHQQAAFHLAERSFGRFGRVIRLNGAFDAGRAEARLAAGELRIVLPRIEDRRGRRVRVPIRI